MIRLQISNFSSIDSADVTLSRLTVLIGPQASGKSVISKLVYFSINVLNETLIGFEDGSNIEEFKERLASEFKKWFPISAWGKKKFQVKFEAGPYSIEITRKGAPTKKGKSGDKIEIVFSDYFTEQYELFMEQFRARKMSTADSPPVEHDPIEIVWRVRSAFRRKLLEDLDGDYTAWQLFIPAGRSFFTSVGKAIAAFEHGGMLEPLTIRFGRFFASVRERGHQQFLARNLSKEAHAARLSIMTSLFGGSIKVDREQEYVETPDGRKLPFYLLSSGQQELLPLWMALDSNTRDNNDQSLIFIEEPEAHLFPTAQSLITKFLARLVSGPENRHRILITTHSPYVVTVINNLLKAGSITQSRPDLRTEVEKIVGKGSALRPEYVSAYAIHERNVIRILDPREGLINAEYLDQISSEISTEFSTLLELETRK